MRHQRLSAAALLCAFALSCFTTVPSTGCAAAIPFIHDVATVIADVTGALDAVEAQVKSRPDADADLVRTVVDAIAKARKALLVVQAAARTAESVSSKDYVSAVDALLEAYDAVTALAKELGVLQAPASTRSRLGGPPGVQLVPTTGELRADLLREPAR